MLHRIPSKIISWDLHKKNTRCFPFSETKFRRSKRKKVALTRAELLMILNKDFRTERLNNVRDIFIYSCFTGLSYGDLKKLNYDDIKIDSNKNLWIDTTRIKTKVEARIPLLSIPLMIMDKYKGLPNGKVLRVLSNQKMNEYLGEIEGLCNIDKRLHCHIARHTFATTISLSNGVSMESISSMLGHTSVKTTEQNYATVVDDKKLSEIKAIKRKLNVYESAFKDNCM